MHSPSCFETHRSGARVWKDLRSRHAALLLSMRACNQFESAKIGLPAASLISDSHSLCTAPTTFSGIGT